MKHIVDYYISKKGITNLLFMCCLLPLLLSCTNDDENKRHLSNGGNTEVTLSISIPYPVISLTRGLNKYEEDTIEDIQLLVFDTSGKYLYTSNAQETAVSSTDENNRSFVVTLKTGTVDITILANCRNLINEHFPEGIEAGTDKQTIAEKLTLEIDGKWITDNTDPDYINIPMWGEIGTVTITDFTTSLGATPYEIYRMVAKIDVTTSIPGTTQFTIKDVRVYNYNEKGVVLPSSTNFTTNLPSITGDLPIKGPLLYDGDHIKSDANTNNACRNEIYLFETAAGGKLTHPDNTCLVIGGEYDGVMGYYRIDIQSPSKGYLNVLRNHHYQVIITDVYDIGFKDPDEAYEAFPVGISAQIIDWSAGEIDDMMVDGDYILKVSTDELVFNPSAYTQMMYIYTNHPDGWKFVEDNFVPTVDWIEFSVVKGQQGEYTEVKVTVKENPDESTRTYEIPVVVSNVKKTISFAQLGVGDIELEIFVTPNPVIFGMIVDTPIALTVSTYPFDAPLYFSYEGDIGFESGGFPLDGTTARTIYIHPTDNTTGDMLSGIMTVYIQDSYGHIASCAVNLMQITKITGFEAVLEEPYPARPGKYKFKVKSSVTWQVTDVDDVDWTPDFAGTQAAGDWKEYEFDLGGNPSYGTQREIKVTIYSPDTGETTILEFTQDYIAHYVTPEHAGPIYLSDVTGTKVNFGVDFNSYYIAFSTMSATNAANYGFRVNNTVTNNGMTGAPWIDDHFDIEFENIDLEFTTSTQKAGEYTLLGSSSTYRGLTLTSIIMNPTTLMENKYIDVVKQVPGAARLSPNQNMISRSPFVSEWVNYTYSLHNTYLGNNQWRYPLPASKHTLELKIDENEECIVWTDADLDTRITSAHYGLYMLLNRTVILPIPENTTGANRTIKIFLEVAGKTHTFEAVQFGENPNITITRNGSTNLGVIPTGGANVKYTVTGNHSGIYPVILTPDDIILYQHDGIMQAVIESGSTSIDYPIPPHPGDVAQNRILYLSYANKFYDFSSASNYILTGFVRTPITSVTQSHANYKLSAASGGRVVARSNLVMPLSGGGLYRQALADWTTAVGLDDKYKTSLLSNDYNITSYPVRSDMANYYSCASYSEPDQPPGTVWRMPTITELREMYDNRDVIGGFMDGIYDNRHATNNTFWSISEFNANSVYILDFKTGGQTSNLKSTTGYYRTRCVRNP